MPAKKKIIKIQQQPPNYQISENSYSESDDVDNVSVHKYPGKKKQEMVESSINLESSFHAKLR